ncbi:MAG TPA: hypothetical protein VKT81_01875 [Bryobacteraceae bacterium]|nr:hypothetical protein [Bryobacteraceae bacterium]
MSSDAIKLSQTLLVADEAWIGLALLHREQEDRESFTAKEILDRVKAERATPELRPGVQAHIYLHNVANLEPNSARYRMFYRLAADRFRLYRPGDQTHPSRKGKTKPSREELPAKYHYLLDWYEQVFATKDTAMNEQDDPILQMRGVGKEIWAGTDADEYVRDLRSNWYGDQPDSK